MGGRGRMPTFLRSETNGCDPSGLQMKSRGSISGGIGWICFNALVEEDREDESYLYSRLRDAMFKTSKPPPLGFESWCGRLHR